MKILTKLLTTLIVVFCFSATQLSAQTKRNPFGNVIITIGSDVVLQTSVNGKIPLFTGSSFREEYSHNNNMFRIHTKAISVKNDEAIVTFNIISRADSKKLYHRTKKIRIKRGEKKTFNIKVKLDYAPQRNYLTTVFYEPKEANN